MKKRQITRKLIMAITAAATAAITLGASTYAWFSRNSNVWVEETDLYLDSYDGLLISLDGKSFSQDISSDDLKKKLTGIDNVEEAKEAYSKFDLIGTTVNQEENSEAIKRTDAGDVEFVHDVVDYNENEYLSNISIFNQNVLVAKVTVVTSDNQIVSMIAKDEEDNDLTIDDSNALNGEYILRNSSDELVAIITNFSISGYVNSALRATGSLGDSLDVYVDYKDIGYSHDDVVSIANNNYLKFDLYFRIASDNGAAGAHPIYDLKFSEKTYLKSKELAKATLQNNMVAKNTAEDATDENKYISYKAEDEVTFDVANAMRIGIDSSNTFNTFEVTNKYDLGSSAIEGSTEDDHNKDKNAMYTYYNSLFTKYPLTEAAADGDRFDTLDNYTGASLGKFIYDEDKKAYNDVKITVYVWLEGWDADYFLGTSVNSRRLSINLDFEYKESN